jgi:hypothetical protein
MLILATTTDKISVITSAAVAISAHVSFLDMTTADPPVVKGSTSGKLNTAISTATTTDVVATPAASTIRNIKTLHICNKDATVACDITVQYNQNATLFQLYKATIPAGATLEYVEGVGFFVVQNVAKLDAKLRVVNDVVFATAASFADITGLTCPVENAKHYNFEAHLYHIGNATTTGAQFAINGPGMTGMILNEHDIILAAPVTGSVMAGSTAVTTRDVAAIVETTGAATIVMAILSGWINPSAAGTFAVRGTSEVSVAAGLTIKAGSWCRIWES